MRRTAAVIGVCLSSVFLSSHCTVSELLPVEGRIFFALTETRPGDGVNFAPVITLVMRTEKAYSSLGYEIKTEMTRSGGQIDLKILGIRPCEGYCPAALGPAVFAKELDLPEGAYTLNLRYRYAEDRYHLIIKPDSLQVVSTVTSFTRPDYSLFWRYPENSFVYDCGTMTETAWICDDFLARLLAEIELEEISFPDDGEIPYPRSANDAPARYFRYETEADFDRAGEMLQSYAESVTSNYEGVGLSLTNWKGRYFYSWLFEPETGH